MRWTVQTTEGDFTMEALSAIDPNRTYRTRDGRAVRIYAADGGGGCPVHGAIWNGSFWSPDWWLSSGEKPSDTPHDLDLIEVTLADELTEQIPWEVLRPEIQWVAMDQDGGWDAYLNKPDRHNDYFYAPPEQRRTIGSALVMPSVDTARWQETLCKRPEDR